MGLTNIMPSSNFLCEVDVAGYVLVFTVWAILASLWACVA